MQRFLTAIDPETTAKARQFAADIQSGDIDAVRTSETLLLALDAMNDLEKAPILAALFAAFLRREMSAADFRRIAAAVNSAVLDDLQALAALGPEPSGSSAEFAAMIAALHHTGLTGDNENRVITSEGVDLGEAITPLGKIFGRAMDHFRTSQKG